MKKLSARIWFAAAAFIFTLNTGSEHWGDGLISAARAQTDFLPRAPGQKLSLAQMQAVDSTNQIWVKFREGTRVRQRSGGLSSPAADGELSAFSGVLSARGISADRISRMFARPEAELDEERATGQAAANRELADLNLYYIIDLPAGADPATVASALNELSIVESAEPAPRPAPPPVDISPTTPDMVSEQGYRTAINLPASTVAGTTGTNMQVVDIEYSWQFNHEDLELPTNRQLETQFTVVDPFNDTNHGTAVLGELVSGNNGYGTTGIVPAATAWVAAANTNQGYNPARAISLASAAIRAGDVILIEQQACVCSLSCNNTTQVGYGPTEWIQSVYDAIAAATANGRIVVQAAGNGNVNLDQTACLNRFNRATRDSGAIIVGAGSSANRSRLSFSSYGSRVDVQGWGQNVTTTGYGDRFHPNSDVRQRYTSTFGGTSSASPIVSGAVLSIQGRLKACSIALRTSAQMRTVLVQTGTAQTGTENIGPLPNVTAAINQLVPICGGGTPVAAAMTSPAAGSTISGPTTFQWNAGTGALEYYLYVGSQGVATANVFNASTGTTRQVTVNSMPAGTLNVRLWTRAADGWRFRDYSYIGAGTPATMTYPTPNSAIGNVTTFDWDAGNYALEHWLYVGTSQGAANVFSSSMGLKRQAVVNTIPSGTVYARLWTRLSNGWHYRDYTYSCCGGGVASALLTPVPNSAIAGGFWISIGAGSNVLEHWVYVGSSQGAADLHNSGSMGTAAWTLAGTNPGGGPVWVRVWSRLASGWEFRDYTLASTCSSSVMTSPIPGSRIAIDTEFVWSRGCAATRYWLSLGTSHGAANIYDRDRGAALFTTVSGIPRTTNSFIWVRLWSLISGAWQYRDYQYTNPAVNADQPVPPPATPVAASSAETP